MTLGQVLVILFAAGSFLLSLLSFIVTLIEKIKK